MNPDSVDLTESVDPTLVEFFPSQRPTFRVAKGRPGFVVRFLDAAPMDVEDSQADRLLRRLDDDSRWMDFLLAIESHLAVKR